VFFAGPFASLCKSCHDKHAQDIERRGYSSRVGVDGFPRDSNHPFNRW
jgi:hypothetical protein